MGRKARLKKDRKTTKLATPQTTNSDEQIVFLSNEQWNQLLAYDDQSPDSARAELLDIIEETPGEIADKRRAALQYLLGIGVTLTDEQQKLLT